MSASPTLRKRDVNAAITEVGRDGVPKGRASTKFCLVADGSHYPPKYVIAVAAQHAVGRALRPHEHSGGTESNSILERLGFSVVVCNCGGSTTKRSPQVARVVVHGSPTGTAKSAERMLLDVFLKQWPGELNAKFVITPGGFVVGEWPRSWAGSSGWQSSAVDLAPLLNAAKRKLTDVVTDRVLNAARGKCEILTIGIDLFDHDTRSHAELVAVFDVGQRKSVRWTGKSYPTGPQEQDLVHVAELKSHLLEAAGERVLVLGCHDLNMFSPRAKANQSPTGERRYRCDEMKRRVARFKPTVVLQHPHSTDTPNIWRMPWMALQRDFPSVRTWASGLGYYNRRGRARAPLERVLALTKSNEHDVVDIVVPASSYR